MGIKVVSSKHTTRNVNSNPRNLLIKLAYNLAEKYAQFWRDMLFRS